MRRAGHAALRRCPVPGDHGMCLVRNCARSLDCGGRSGPSRRSQLPAARSGHEQALLPAASSVCGASPNITSFSPRACKALRPSSQYCWMSTGWAGIGLAACCGVCDLGSLLLTWVAATHLTGMAWSFDRLVHASSGGFGFPSWSMAAGNAVHWPSMSDQGPRRRDRSVGPKGQSKHTCRRQPNPAPALTAEDRLAPHGRLQACAIRAVRPDG